MEDASIAKYREEFAKAESAIRYADYSINILSSDTSESKSEEDGFTERVKGVTTGIVVPAINELRYSAKHFSDYIGDEKNIEDLRRAIRHCYRARYDALRATALFLIRNFRDFLEDYRMLPLADIVGIDDHQIVVENTLELLCKQGDTEDECIRLQKSINILSPFFKRYTAHRNDLNNKLLLLEMKRQSYTTWIVGIICLIVGFALNHFF